MIFNALFNGILGSLEAVTYFLPTVTTLPFGVDDAMVYFISTIKGFVNLMPWVGTIFNLIMLAIGIKFSLFLWHWAKYFINLMRGSGA